MKRPRQGLRRAPGSLVDPFTRWRDWASYRIVSVGYDDDAGYTLELVSNKPGLYAPIRDAQYLDFLHLPIDDRNVIIENTTGKALQDLADAELAYDKRQQQRVIDAVEADHRVKYRRALAPESYLIYNDAREQLNALRLSMRRKDVPVRVVVDDQGTEEQHVMWVRQAISEAQLMEGPAEPRDALIARLRVTEARLVQDWNRLVELSGIISTSEWVRDKQPWGPLYNPHTNLEREALLRHYMTQIPEVEKRDRSTFNVLH